MPSETTDRQVRLADWGEFAFIDFLAGRLPPASGRLEVGIGDDAAVWSAPAGKKILTTLDMLVEGVHFDLGYTSAADLGRKVLAVNLSDLAAMGGVPGCAFLGLGLPPLTTRGWLEDFIDSFLRLAAASGVELAGGDTVRSERLVISVTLNGTGGAASGRRAGAAVGDDIYCSGTIGDSYLGLRILTGRLAAPADRAAADFLCRRHLRPTARLGLGQKLVAAGAVSAMIDVSDGLAADLGHLLAAAGGLGAELEAERLPFSDAARQLLTAGETGLTELLSGGEDFELLFTAPPEKNLEIAGIAAALELPVTRIGRVGAKPGIRLAAAGGVTEFGRKGGYDHFHTQDQ